MILARTATGDSTSRIAGSSASRDDPACPRERSRSGGSTLSRGGLVPPPREPGVHGLSSERHTHRGLRPAVGRGLGLLLVSVALAATLWPSRAEAQTGNRALIFCEGFCKVPGTVLRNRSES